MKLVFISLKCPSKENVQTGFSSTLPDHHFKKRSAGLIFLFLKKNIFYIMYPPITLSIKPLSRNVKKSGCDNKHRGGPADRVLCCTQLSHMAICCGADLKGIKRHPGHMAQGTYSRSARYAFKTNETLYLNKKKKSFNTLHTKL